MDTSWQVTGDVPNQWGFDAASNAVAGHVVSFTTGRGNKGSVFVPDDHYTVDEVRALVAAQAKRADDIRSLSSGG